MSQAIGQCSSVFSTPSDYDSLEGFRQESFPVLPGEPADWTWDFCYMLYYWTTILSHLAPLTPVDGIPPFQGSRKGRLTFYGDLTNNAFRGKCMTRDVWKWCDFFFTQKSAIVFNKNWVVIVLIGNKHLYGGKIVCCDWLLYFSYFFKLTLHWSCTRIFLGQSMNFSGAGKNSESCLQNLCTNPCQFNSLFNTVYVFMEVFS